MCHVVLHRQPLVVELEPELVDPGLELLLTSRGSLETKILLKNIEILERL